MWNLALIMSSTSKISGQHFAHLCSIGSFWFVIEAAGFDTSRDEAEVLADYTRSGCDLVSLLNRDICRQGTLEMKSVRRAMVRVLKDGEYCGSKEGKRAGTKHTPPSIHY